MITDFVHLEWAFTSKAEYPKKDGLYLCLIAPADIAPETELKVLFYDSNVGIFYDEDECKYSCVVAWVFPGKYTFTCDPTKHKNCPKTICGYPKYSDRDVGKCYQTIKLACAKGYDPDH